VILGQWRNSYASPSLCEIACSLNENVERLAFSCVWTMNMDGTLNDNTGVGESIFYGRSVIKSYARLDNATAQNIIDNKVAIGEAHADESFCSKRRQPTGGHTIDEVADDVRLMHKVAMARRKLRFENGALALNGIKLAFKLIVLPSSLSILSSGSCQGQHAHRCSRPQISSADEHSPSIVWMDQRTTATLLDPSSYPMILVLSGYMTWEGNGYCING
jgi:hypothetical protein